MPSTAHEPSTPSATPGPGLGAHGARGLPLPGPVRPFHRRLLRVGALVAGDALGVAAVLWGVGHLAAPGVPADLSLFPLVAAVGLLSQAALGTYGPGQARRSYGRVWAGAGLATAVLGVWAAAYSFVPLSAGALLLIFAGTGLLFSTARAVGEAAVRETYRRGIGRRKTLIVGDQETAWEVLEHFRAAEKRDVEVVGHLAPNPAEDPTALGGLDLLPELVRRHDVRQVIVAGDLGPSRYRKLLRRCLRWGVQVSVVPREMSDTAVRVSGRDFLGLPVLDLELPRFPAVGFAVKRAIDVVGAGVGLLALAPLLGLVALAVKLDSPGPVLFRQRRLGLGGRRFTMYKFRTMRTDAERLLRRDPELYRKYVENDFKLPPEEDPRISRLGAFLRRLSLDELPQLYNVLRGHMSLVGPRPVVPREIARYGELAPVVLGMKPGITGLWQVSGRSEVRYPERAIYDLRYITQWSLGLDLKILLSTPGVVLRRKGAH